MKKIIEYRAQEMICRQRATFDPQHKHHWLSQAEMWWHKAQDELDCNVEADNVEAGNAMPPGARPEPTVMKSRAHRKGHRARPVL